MKWTTRVKYLSWGALRDPNSQILVLIPLASSSTGIHYLPSYSGRISLRRYTTEWRCVFSIIPFISLPFAVPTNSSFFLGPFLFHIDVPAAMDKARRDSNPSANHTVQATRFDSPIVVVAHLRGPHGRAELPARNPIPCILHPYTACHSTGSRRSPAESADRFPGERDGPPAPHGRCCTGPRHAVSRDASAVCQTT